MNFLLSKKANSITITPEYFSALIQALKRQKNLPVITGQTPLQQEEQGHIDTIYSVGLTILNAPEEVEEVSYDASKKVAKLITPYLLILLAGVILIVVIMKACDKKDTTSLAQLQDSTVSKKMLPNGDTGYTKQTVTVIPEENEAASAQQAATAKKIGVKPKKVVSEVTFGTQAGGEVLSRVDDYKAYFDSVLSRDTGIVRRLAEQNTLRTNLQQIILKDTGLLKFDDPFISAYITATTNTGDPFKLHYSYTPRYEIIGHLEGQGLFKKDLLYLDILPANPNEKVTYMRSIQYARKKRWYEKRGTAILVGVLVGGTGVYFITK